MISKNLIGQIFGKLTVEEEAKSFNSHKYYRCRCICGVGKRVCGVHLTSGKIKSCLKCSDKNHGMTRTKTHNSWQAMLCRCYNSKHNHFHLYGGRGITVCDEWKYSYKKFQKDMGIRPTKNHSIDRINNNLGYYKENCKWSTKEEQANNRKTNVYYIFNNQKLSRTQLCKIIGINHNTFFSREKRGNSYPIGVERINE